MPLLYSHPSKLKIILSVHCTAFNKKIQIQLNLYYLLLNNIFTLVFDMLSLSAIHAAMVEYFIFLLFYVTR